MRNVFLLYMPPSNAEAMAHYEDTIKQRVTLDRVARYLSRDEASRLSDIFGDQRIAVWGSRESSRNRSIFSKMAVGDDLLIVEGKTIRFIGKVALKSVNPVLSRNLWKNLDPMSSTGWDLIYFIANPLEVKVPFSAFCRLFGLKTDFQLRGFTTLSNDRVKAFYDEYDDLYSVLLRSEAAEPIRKKPALVDEPIAATADLVEVQPEEMEAVIDSPLVSDHAKMQWKLARLGRKAGEKVWVPRADQGKLRTLYQFSEFEPEFTAGIDLPKNYVENIDVVWKEQFRIKAAFEVENSTAIYSGLLRFADLNIYAPNSPYPMFIVAPSERRNRVDEQLRRPAFKRLELRDKVKFLPYEAVNEIDQFFSGSSSGLSVELIAGKAEGFG